MIFVVNSIALCSISLGIAWMIAWNAVDQIR